MRPSPSYWAACYGIVLLWSQLAECSVIPLDGKLGTQCQLGFIFAVAKAIGLLTAPVCRGTPTDVRGAHVLWLRVAPACRLAADSALLVKELARKLSCVLSLQL